MLGSRLEWLQVEHFDDFGVGNESPVHHAGSIFARAVTSNCLVDRLCCNKGIAPTFEVLFPSVQQFADDVLKKDQS